MRKVRKVRKVRRVDPRLLKSECRIENVEIRIDPLLRGQRGMGPGFAIQK